MQVELDRAESKLAEKREELRILKEHIRTEAAEMVARKKRFRVYYSPYRVTYRDCNFVFFKIIVFS